jgi:hypothetical protein
MLGVGNREDMNMNEKIDDPRSTEEISAPQARERYVLENVFWVPLSNCRFSHSSSSLVPPEPHSENHDKERQSIKPGRD